MLNQFTISKHMHPAVAIFWAALLPIPLFGAPLLLLHLRGDVGPLELCLGLAASLLVTVSIGTIRLRQGDGLRRSAGMPSGPEFCDCGDGLFDVFMAHSPALAFLKDSKGRYLYVNAACAKMWKRPPEAVIGRSDSELWPDEIARPLCQNDAQILGSDQVFSAVDRLLVGAEERFHLMTKFPVTNNGRRMLGGIAFDITDKVRAEAENARLEQQLIQSQKMEAIGTLAGGIAHDFNNVLAAIMGYVELAQLDARPGSTVQYELAQVLKATHRAKDLVRQILSFSRKTEHDRQPFDPLPLVKEALTLLRASIPSTIEIRQHYGACGFQVLANATQFHQVMMNLCTNAAHAMEEAGGVMEVHLHKVSLTGATAGLQGVAPGRYLEVRVRDNGPGITPALQERIFDPYFTTKAQGKGSGMGLAVVRSIVKSHGGSIDVESEPGSGACFCVLLPITTQLAQITSEQTKTLPSGTESILFVDDESVLADLGKQMLSRLGYRVTCCERSLDALALVQENPTGFDLVITDTTMPHMTGDALAAQVLAIRPDLPIILCTGYSEQIDEQTAARLGISAFLMKPLAISDLAHKLRNVLDNRPPVDAPPCSKAGFN
jgi:signal transduction histidine kinase/ActR/RegA family two-component response regulator